MKVIIFIVLCLVGASYQRSLANWDEVDVSEPIVQTMVQTVIEYHNTFVNESPYYENLVEIQEAGQQSHDNGLFYAIMLVLGETHCAIQDAGAPLCPVEENSPKELCVYTLWKESTGQNATVSGRSCLTI